MRAISLGYHDIPDEVPDAASAPSLRYKVSASEFRKHLRQIREKTSNMSSVCVVDRFRTWGREVPVFLTFDDGELSSYTIVADELERNNCRGHFFVVTDWIGRAGYLNERQIQDLHGRGHIIGSHTCSHPERMSSLSWDALIREWTDSCAVLGRILGMPVKVASVANGFYSPMVAKAAAVSGIEVLFTSEPRAKIATLDRCLILGRYSIQRHTTAAVAGAIAGGERWRRWLQTVRWVTAKPLKALTGESYFAIRKFLLSGEIKKTKPIARLR